MPLPRAQGGAAARREQEAAPPGEAQARGRSYRGVRRRSWGRYVSEIRLPGQNTRVWLGSYSNPESAARAHDAAAFFLHGDPTALNFPEAASSLPRPKSSSPADIREAAALAASATGSSRAETAATPAPGAGAVEEEAVRGGSWGEWWEAVEDAKEAPLHSPVRVDGSWDGYGYSEFWVEDSLLWL